MNPLAALALFWKTGLGRIDDENGIQLGERKVSGHELFGVAIHECVLDGAMELLEATAGQELPGLAAYLGPEPENFDEDKDELEVVVKYSEMRDFNGVIRDIEGCFVIPESVIKGIAARRSEDLQTFLDALLPGYRAGLISSELQYEFHTFDGEEFFLHEDTRMISVREVSGIMTSFGTSPWFIDDVWAEEVSKELFRLTVVFLDHEYRISNSGAAAYDQLTLSMSLSWTEYKAAMAAKEKMIMLLRRIHETFLVTKPDLSGSYSAEVKEELTRMDWDEDDEEDPFTSGELVNDSDGRVHSASAFRDN